MCGHSGCADTFTAWTRPSSKGRSSVTSHGQLHARQATISLAHIVREAWTGPKRCRNDRESAVRVRAWGKPLDGTKPCAREAFTIHSVRKCSWCFIIISLPKYSLTFRIGWYEESYNRVCNFNPLTKASCNIPLVILNSQLFRQLP